jgi:hypothetical protein
VTAAGSRFVTTALAAIVAAYLPFLGGGLLTDDFVHIAHLEDLASAGQLAAVPDAFGFYRPLTQASLALDAAMFGGHAAAFRAESLVLHALVIAAAFVVARLVLPSAIAAAAAALAFALTPKAHPIAVLWLSARGELLMALFTLICVAAWIQWSRQRGAWWLAAATASYLLALLSKETAILLPALLLVSPGGTRPVTARLRGVLLLCGLAALVLWWRAQTGALMPFSNDEHYNLGVPLFRVGRNLRNYVERMLPAPIVLIACAALISRTVKAGTPRTVKVRATLPSSEGRDHARLRGPLWSAILFSLAWTLLLLVPVLGIVARNELYLYLPTFGLCLFAAAVAAPWLDRAALTRVSAGGVALCVVGLAAYQVTRSAAFHDDLVFSSRLVQALADAPAVQRHGGDIALVPGEGDDTRQFLQDAIGGYTPLVARRALGRGSVAGTAGTLRLRCDYQDGRVTLQPL